MAVLCIFPFFGLLVLKGLFSSALSWITKGETASLNRRQLNVIRILNYLSLAVYLMGLTILVTVLAARSGQTQN